MITASAGETHRAVFDEIAEVGIFFLTDGRLQRDRLLRDLEHLAHLRHRDVHALGDLLRRRLATEFLHKLPRGADQLVDGLDHVHRNTDGARLVGDGAGDGLTDPPRRVGRELVATAVLELVHRFHQADVAFLNEVEELQAAVGVLLRDRNHEAQVGLDEFALGVLGIDVALHDLALRALEFGEGGAGVAFHALQVGADAAHLLAQFLLLLVGASWLRRASRS